MTTQVMSYKYPYYQPSVTGQNEIWTTITPSNASTQTSYTSMGNSNLLFQLASNSAMMRTHQTYLSFHITPRRADGSVVTGAGAVSSAQGCSRAFNRLTIRAGSTMIESFEYDDIVGMYYSTLSDTKNKWFKRHEGLGNTGVFANGSKEFAMVIFSSLFSNPQHLPLPIFGSGLQLDFQLAPVENPFLSPEVTHFTIENPVLRTCLVHPDPSCVLALTSAVAQNRSTWLPMTELRTFKTPGLNSTNLLVTAAVGAYTSIDSVTCTMYSVDAYNARTNDKFKRFVGSGDLKDWSIEISGITNPATRRFGNSGGSLETTMLYFLSSCGNIHELDDYNLPDDFETAHFRWGLNFQSSNELHGTGISTVGAASTNVVIDTTFNTAIPSNFMVYTIVSCSTLLEITGSMVNFWRVF